MDVEEEATNNALYTVDDVWFSGNRKVFGILMDALERIMFEKKQNTNANNKVVELYRMFTHFCNDFNFLYVLNKNK